MAISRVEGPMLLTNLDRQGIDLSFTTNPGTGTRNLTYMDFTNFRLGVGNISPSSTPGISETLTVAGNIVVSNYIKSPTNTNGNIYLLPDGTGKVIVTNISIISGTINGLVIGDTTPANAFFVNANVNAKLTANLIQATNISANSVVYSNGAALISDTRLQWFAANGVLAANSIQTTGTVGYSSLNITGSFIYNYGTYNYVPFFAANNVMIVDPGLQYFVSNSILRANSIQVSGLGSGYIPYIGTNSTLNTRSGLTYDGFNLSVLSGTTTISKLVFGSTVDGTTITTSQVDLPIYIRPQGLGTVDVSGFRVTSVSAPVLGTDAATKSYVDGLIVGIGANIISQQNSLVNVIDAGPDLVTGLSTANISVIVNGHQQVQFLPYAANTLPSFSGYTYIGQWQINNNTLTTTQGDAQIVPAQVGMQPGRVILNTTTSLLLPQGTTTQRPTSAITGDLRFNTDLDVLEWYAGSANGWTAAAQSAPTTSSQIIVPNGVSATYTLTQAATSSSVLVMLNGVVQQADAAYYVTGTNLTFLLDIPLITDIIEVRYLASSYVYATDPVFVSTPFANIATAPGGGTMVDTFVTTYYVGASYQFVAKNITTGQYQMGTATLLQNGTTANVQATITNIIGSPVSPLITWTALDSLGILKLTATASTANTYLKFSRTYFNPT